MQTEPAPLHELMRICMRGGTARQWEEFLARVQPLIARTAYRVACSAGSPQHDEVDDIVQETCLKLGATRTESLSRAELSSEASVWAYIKVVELNTARDHFAWKRRRPAITESELPAPIDQLAGAVCSPMSTGTFSTARSTPRLRATMPRPRRLLALLPAGSHREGNFGSAGRRAHDQRRGKPAQPDDADGTARIRSETRRA